MSKLTGELSYKDWMILKHALEDKIKSKEKFLNAIDEEIKKIMTLESSFKTYEKINKEFTEEKATLERVIKLTDNFKEYIKGNERHYLSDPYWI